MVGSTGVGKLSVCDKNMQKGPNLNNTQKEGETGNHPQQVPGLQKRAPVKSYPVTPLAQVLSRPQKLQYLNS